MPAVVTVACVQSVKAAGAARAGGFFPRSSLSVGFTLTPPHPPPQMVSWTLTLGDTSESSGVPGPEP